jgi:hypothetical protein
MAPSISREPSEALQQSVGDLDRPAQTCPHRVQVPRRFFTSA